MKLVVAQILNTIHNTFSESLSIYCWCDFFEITIISLLVYAIMSWLKNDRTNYPLVSMCAYAALLAVTYYAQLAVVSTLLLLVSPIFILMLITVHQQTLQKNFVTYRSIKTLSEHESTWIDELIRACFYAINKQKEVVCIIERYDSLTDLVSTPCLFHAQLTYETASFYIEATPQKELCTLWVHAQGKIVASRVKVKDDIELETMWLDPELHKLPSWKQDAIFITHKTDALVIKASCETRHFDCIGQGKVLEQLSAQQTIALLKRYLIAEQNTPKTHQKDINTKDIESQNTGKEYELKNNSFFKQHGA